MSRLAHIWRYPIKSHGVEALERAELSTGACLPWDRHWAVAHEASRADGTRWVPCANFSRGAKAPALMAIKAQLDEERGTLTLTHPELPPLRFDPEREEAAFLEWVAPIMPENRAASARILRVPGRAMTDTDFPSISINSLASLNALGEQAGQALSPLRFRGNLWLEGLEPWEEFDWIGKTLRLGEAELEVRERITRCLATAANPETGERDADTLGALDSGWGHRDFGVYAVVTKPGAVALGDMAEPRG